MNDNENKKDYETPPENSPQLQSGGKDEKKKRTARLILIFIIVFIIVFCGVYFGIQLFYNKDTPPEVTTEKSTAATTQALAENPIDFEALKKQNSDIYAWIKVPGTKVDYPIVQSSQDDSFYLKHSAEDKSWSESGAVYTEMVNRKYFRDPITVIYGHNGYGDSMFTTLHNFEKEEFFNSHSEFVIYTEGRKLTYQIISAFKYDDRHIMNSFNFADTTELAKFQDYLQNPENAVKNVRADLDTDIDTDSKIVILSTCITNQKSNRYLVCGVLIKDEKTN